MDYKIMEKEAFTVVGVAKIFSYEEAKTEIPKFWTEHYQSGGGEFVCGMYGVNVDTSFKEGDDVMQSIDTSSKFEYIIADDYIPTKEMPSNFKTTVIPKHTWAVFPCKGAMPNALQEVNQKIFSEWLPNCKDYEIAAGYNIEYYTDIRNYPKGNMDENYYSEIWIPVKKKS